MRTLEADRSRFPSQIPRINVPYRKSIDSNKRNQLSNRKGSYKESANINGAMEHVVDVNTPLEDHMGTKLTVVNK